MAIISNDKGFQAVLDFFSLVQDRKKIQVSVGRVLDL